MKREYAEVTVTKQWPSAVPAIYERDRITVPNPQWRWWAFWRPKLLHFRVKEIVA